MSKRLWQTHHSRDTNRCHSRETSGNVKEWRLGSTWMWLCSHFGGGSLGLCSAIYAQLMAACGTWKLIEIDYGSHTLPLFPSLSPAATEQNKCPSSLEASWEIALETNNAASRIYICLIIIYMRPPPVATSSAGTHLCTYGVCECVYTYVLPVQTTNSRRWWCLCCAAAFEVRHCKRTSIVRILPHYPLDCGRPQRAGLSDVQRDIATCGRP